MNKPTDKKRKFFRFLFTTLSLTTVAFVFQACYGTPHDGAIVDFYGTVKSKTTNKPIQGIKVYFERTKRFMITDEEGKFYFYGPLVSDYQLRFEDIDGDKNGAYLQTDTTVYNEDYSKTYFELDILLNEK